MTKERGSNKNVWKIMIILSIIFIFWTLFVISSGNEILPTAFKLAGSSQLTSDIEINALRFMHMTMLNLCGKKYG